MRMQKIGVIFAEKYIGTHALQKVRTLNVVDRPTSLCPGWWRNLPQNGIR